MHRIQKGQPPHNVAPPGQQPRSLQQAAHALHQALPTAERPEAEARSHFDALYKPHLTKALARCQRAICVYCERRLHEDNTNPIEHWHPVNACPELALHWPNLYLSCPDSKTCDGSKGGQPLSPPDEHPEHDQRLPWPTDFSYEVHLLFKLNGEVEVRPSPRLPDWMEQALKRALNTTLNLNHPNLILARKSALRAYIDRFTADYEDKHVTKASRAQLAEALQQSDPSPAFVSVITAWLTKQIGRP